MSVPMPASTTCWAPALSTCINLYQLSIELDGLVSAWKVARLQVIFCLKSWDLNCIVTRLRPTGNMWWHKYYGLFQVTKSHLVRWLFKINGLLAVCGANLRSEIRTTNSLRQKSSWICLSTSFSLPCINPQALIHTVSWNQWKSCWTELGPESGQATGKFFHQCLHDSPAEATNILLLALME